MYHRTINRRELSYPESIPKYRTQPYKMELSSKLNEYCKMWKPELMVSMNKVSDTYHFIPRVHGNLSVPLWVYMHFPVPENQN